MKFRSKEKIATRNRAQIPVEVCRFQVELLEPRRLLAGVTLITHGFAETNVYDPWVHAMGQAIVRTNAANQIDTCEYEMDVSGSNGNLTYSVTQLSGPTPTASSNAEIVIELNWAAVAGLPLTSTITVANTVAGAFLSTTAIPGLGVPLAQLPLHLIGHSRGGSLVTALAQDLGQSGIWVDQVTTLDPHPVIGDAHDPSDVALDSEYNGYHVQLSNNVVFADNFFETNLSASNPDYGEPVDGAHNVDLTSAVDSSHEMIQTYYYGTVDPSAVTDAANGIDSSGDAIEAAWYAPGVRTQTGFAWSLLGGVARPIDGIAPIGGGTADRIPVALTTNQPYSDVGALSISGGTGATYADGSSITFGFRYQDVNGGGSIKFDLDNDTNPYDGTIKTIAENDSLPATGSPPQSLAANVSGTWSNAGLSPGLYNIRATIVSSSGQTRYFYIPGAIRVPGNASDAPVVASNPTSQSGAAGSTATFTAAASGNPTPIVQWQISTDGGSTFSNITINASATTTATATTTGATATLTLTNVAANQSGTQYRAVFTNSAGSASTAAATLTVTTSSDPMPSLTAVVTKSTVPASIVEGEKIPGSIKLTTRNDSGATETGNAQIQLWATTDGAIDGSAVLISTVKRHVQVKAGKTFASSLHLKNLPSPLAAGDYLLMTRTVDVRGVATDSSTGKTITVLPPITALATTIGTVPTMIVPGKTYNIRITVQNQGNVDYDGSILLNLGLAADGQTFAATPAGISRSIKLKTGKSLVIHVRLVLPTETAAGTYQLMLLSVAAGKTMTQIASQVVTVA